MLGPGLFLLAMMPEALDALLAQVAQHGLRELSWFGFL